MGPHPRKRDILSSDLSATAFIGEPTKSFFERFPPAPVDRVMSGHELRDKLRQLPELDETGGRVVPEITFRLATEADEVRIVDGEKPEISRPDHAAREVPQNPH
jgi:hypothetical protein